MKWRLGIVMKIHADIWNKKQCHIICQILKWQKSFLHTNTIIWALFMTCCKEFHFIHFVLASSTIAKVMDFHLILQIFSEITYDLLKQGMNCCCTMISFIANHKHLMVLAPLLNSQNKLAKDGVLHFHYLN